MTRVNYTGMTPQQKIQAYVLAVQETMEMFEDNEGESNTIPVTELTTDNIEWTYNAYGDSSMLSTFRSEGAQEETSIDAPWSRHYESKSVATDLGYINEAGRWVTQCWVGWTYWYGGGKHGEPEEMDWFSHAYDLNVTEEYVMTTKYAWEKV